MSRDIYRTRRWRELRQHVLDRDGWRCGLCHGLISPNATGPLAGTADHVIPVARGGAELDARNLRAAHRGCNARRRDRLAARVVEHDPTDPW